MLCVGILVTALFIAIDVKCTSKDIDVLQDTIWNQSVQIADLHDKLKTISIDMFALKETQKLEVAQAEPHVEQTAFDTRIAQIKNELGLRAQIAEEHEKQEYVPTGHPNVYNIPTREHDGYMNKNEIEFAR